VASKLARFSWLPGGLTAAAIIAVGRLASSPSSAPAELPAYDWTMSLASVAPPNDVIVVAVDGESIGKLGPYPWPLATHAELIDRLHAGGARVVAFADPLGSPPSGELERVRAALALLEASSLSDSQQANDLRKLLGERGQGSENRFAQAARAHGNVVIPLEVNFATGSAANETALPATLLAAADTHALDKAHSASIVRPPEASLIAAAKAAGHLHRDADADGTVRTEVAAVRVNERLLPSFSIAVAARAAALSPDQLIFASDSDLRMGSRAVRMESPLKLRPHYFRARDARTIKQYSYIDVMEGRVTADQLRGRIVIVGATETSAMGAAIATPVDAASPPVLVQASAVSSLLHGPAYTRSLLSSAVEWVAAGVVILVAAFVLPHIPLAFGAIATGLLIVVLAITEFGMMQSAQTWVRMILPCVALLVGFAMYGLGEFIRRANTKSASKDPTSNLRSLGQTFQRQGQLDLAFETYRRCPLDAPTMELLYFLGADFERRRQMQKADAVYGYIATRDPNYRDLRVRRVRVKETAIAQDTSGGDSQPRRAPPPPVRRDDLDATHPVLPARTLGRYEIERELGKGAMGVVYLGRDPKINRVVAIKAIPLAEEFEEEDLAEARARFFREAEMAGRLNHPSIVTVHDAGEDQGLAYIAMEYLRGQHLSHFADPSRLLPPRKVMLLVARVADALHYAHRQNVVHRDIKPANIMYNPETDELKITDFGIARLTDTSRTKTGIVLGTPSFMSPEQLEGRNLDGRSDQFALGVSLFQLLCGHLPFRADSMPRLMQKIATEPHASVRVLRPDLPEGIDVILDRVLAKSADDRYATCAEFAAALRACAGEERPAPAEPKHEWLIP
jgi:CHASE2 domain-containing sensor protein